MSLCRVHHNKNYTVINNTIVTDTRLSWKAKGIWLYAFSRPDDWTFYIADLIKQSTDGKDAVTSGLKELEECGYLVRLQKRKEDGTFSDPDWHFFETPQELKKCLPKTENPSTDKPLSENPPLLNTDSLLSTKKEQQQQQGALPPEPPSLPAAVVVVSSNEKKKILETFGFDEDSLDVLTKYPIERIEMAIAALSQAQEYQDIPNPKGWLRTAIEKAWEPNITKKDLDNLKEQETNKQKEIENQRFKECCALHKQYKLQFNESFAFWCHPNKIELKFKGKMAILYYTDDKCVENLRNYINLNTKKDETYDFIKNCDMFRSVEK